VIKKNFIPLLTALALLLNVHCKQHYLLPETTSTANTLVVEAVINTGGDETTIKLSRTVKLTDTANFLPEPGATVSVESNASTSGTTVMQFSDVGAGSYIGYAYSLSPANNYRLRIVTSAGVTYLSDFVPVKNSPPVDSLNFEVQSDGVHVYSNTHDQNNTTRYYRWDYNETWIIHSEYESYYETSNNPTDTIFNRPAQDELYTCWTSDASSTIILNSSQKLSQDVIVHNPVAFIASNSEKFRQEYSIQVTQYALTPDAFNYWQNLKLNTEQLGSIFDAQPSAIQGNIHCVTNPSEPVRGYLSVGAPSQARLFIGTSSLPQVWLRTIQTPYDQCLLDSLYFKNPKNGNNDVSLLYAGGLIPVQAIIDTRRITIGYSGSTQYCVDCRFRGTNVRPYYWVDKY
jgi:hypothetical protein